SAPGANSGRSGSSSCGFQPQRLWSQTKPWHMHGTELQVPTALLCTCLRWPHVQRWCSVDERSEPFGSLLSEDVIAVLAVGHADGTGPGLPGQEVAELGPRFVSVAEGVDDLEVLQAAAEVLLPGIHAGDTHGRKAGQRQAHGVDRALRDADEGRVALEVQDVEEVRARAFAREVLGVPIALVRLSAPEADVDRPGGGQVR